MPGEYMQSAKLRAFKQRQQLREESAALDAEEFLSRRMKQRSMGSKELPVRLVSMGCLFVWAGRSSWWHFTCAIISITSSACVQVACMCVPVWAALHGGHWAGAMCAHVVSL